MPATIRWISIHHFWEYLWCVAWWIDFLIDFNCHISTIVMSCEMPCRPTIVKRSGVVTSFIYQTKTRYLLLISFTHLVILTGVTWYEIYWILKKQFTLFCGVVVVEAAAIGNSQTCPGAFGFAWNDSSPTSAGDGQPGIGDDIVRWINGAKRRRFCNPCTLKILQIRFSCFQWK